MLTATEIEKWGDTETWIQYIRSIVIAHGLQVAGDCFLEQKFAVTRAWDTPKGAHTQKRRNAKLLLNSLKFAQWDP